MSDIAIRCDGLGKRYRIGERERYKALRDVITDAAAAPFRKLRTAFSNSHSNGNGINGNGHSHSSLITHDSSPGDGNGPALTSDLRPQTSDLFWALKDVSFEVKRGEVVGIIGRNGAGKSTLLKILSRITAPTEGEVEVKGRVGSLLEVGTGFHPELTGRENIFLNGAILGMKRAEINRKFDEMVAFAEIEKFIDTPVKRYSSGMYVRLAFAVAAHLEPEILVVDEVLAVGDGSFQKKCLRKMGDVASAGRTVLFVSHNMGAIQRLCGRCILLEAGSISAEGNPRNVIPDYLSRVHTTPSERLITDRDCEVDLTVMDETGSPTRIWNFGQKLKVKISISTRTPLMKPAVDLSFHSDTQARLFAFESDKLATGPDRIKGNWNITFEIENPGLTVREIYFDVGIRQGTDPYLILIREAARLFSDHSSAPLPSLDDCLLYTRVVPAWESVGDSLVDDPETLKSLKASVS
jgi:lipopolysaccharide transport system ATP-binding protein